MKAWGKLWFCMYKFSYSGNPIIEIKKRGRSVPIIGRGEEYE